MSANRRLTWVGIGVTLILVLFIALAMAAWAQSPSPNGLDNEAGYSPDKECCCCGGTSTPTPTPTATPTQVPGNPPRIETNKGATPLAQCQMVEVQLEVIGTGDRRALDVMIVLDRSGSMDDAGGSPLQPITDAKDAAKALIDELDSSVDRVGLVSYSTSATLDQGLTSNFNAVKTSIDGLVADGRTNIGDAVYTAQAELNSNGRSDAVHVMVVLSDGVANERHSGGSCTTWPSSPTACTDDAINQAAAAKNAGTVMYTIGLNLDGVGAVHGQAVEDLARSVLQTMASAPSNYYESPDSSDLQGIFTNIGGILANAAGTNVVVTDILPADVHYVNGSAVPAPDSVVGQTLTWNLGVVNIDETKTITFKVYLDPAYANQLVDVYPDSRVDYVNYQGQSASMPFPETHVTSLPCPTATPTTTPTTAVASLGDFVWHDLFHSQTHEVDGIQDAGEPGLANVTVELYNSSDVLVATTTTDASGYYHFNNLVPGTYKVKVADSNFSGGVLDGWYATLKDQGGDDTKDSDGDRTTHEAIVTLGPGENNTDVDFGFFYTCVDLQKSGPASVNAGDTVTYSFRVENCGDVVLHGGVSVYDALIEPSGNHEIWWSVVWPGEVYQFDRTYTSTENDCGTLTNTATAVGHPQDPDGSSLPDVSDQASWSTGVQCATPTPTPTPTPTLPSPDISVNKTPRNLPGNVVLVGQTVTFDIEITNIGGTTIVSLPLHDVFDNSCLQYNEKSANPLETNRGADFIDWADLTTSFSQNLAPGQSFSVTVPFVATAVNNLVTNTATVQGAQDEYGQTLPTRYASSTIACKAPASIGDYVWNDANGNGLQDEGTGYGINGVTVRLYKDDGDSTFEPGGDDVLIATQATATDGAYDFTMLHAGTYWVDVDETSAALSGYFFIAGTDSGPEPHLVTVNYGDDYNDADFGYAGKGNITGTVFYDWNKNSTQDLGEDGIGGVTVCLYKDNDGDGVWDNPGDTQLECKTTNSDGTYAFTNYLPGKYLVVETQPGGLEDTTPNVRPVTLIVIGPSGSSTDNDFGEIVHVRLGDFVWMDSNGNGNQDTGESTGISNVPLHVTGVDVVNSSIDITVTTSITGFYVVDNLLPGTYTVTAPASFGGYVRTSTSPLTTTLTTAVTEDMTLDFGYISPTAVQMVAFNVAPQPDQVTLRWQVRTDGEAPKFWVWRSVLGGRWKQLALAPVAAAASDGRTATYTFTDTQVYAGTTYLYRLESAEGEAFGPWQVVVPNADDAGGVAGGQRVFMPFVSH